MGCLRLPSGERHDLNWRVSGARLTCVGTVEARVEGDGCPQRTPQRPVSKVEIHAPRDSGDSGCQTRLPAPPCSHLQERLALRPPAAHDTDLHSRA